MRSSCGFRVVLLFELLCWRPLCSFITLVDVHNPRIQQLADVNFRPRTVTQVHQYCLITECVFGKFLYKFELTDSMDHGAYWEADSRSARHEFFSPFPHPLWPAAGIQIHVFSEQVVIMLWFIYGVAESFVGLF
jgi:hypothetical protein